MFSEDEARVWGGLLTAIGVAVMACGLVRLWWPAADWSLYAASGGIGFGFPLLVAGWKWLKVLGDKADADVRTTVARAWALEVETATREARLTAVAPEPVQPAAPAPPVDHWPQAAHRFLAAANEHGFAIRVLVGKGVVTWEAWGQMVDVLVAAGVMVSRPRAGWAPSWDMARWTRERHSTPLPHDDTDPPTVALVSTTATKTTLTTPTTPLEQA